MAIFKTIGNAFKEGWNKSKQDGLDDDEYRLGKTSFDYTRRYYDQISNKNVSKLSQYAEEDKTISINTGNNNAVSFATFYSHIDDVATSQGAIENPFKLPRDIISVATKNYKFEYEDKALFLGDYGIVENKKEDGGNGEEAVAVNVFDTKVIPSMFNPLYGIQSVGIDARTPIINGLEKDKIKSQEKNTLYSSDTSNCSISTLVQLSNEGKMGAAIYKYADFMYCKDLGKISNNRLITLRRFPTPIGDDIWHTSLNGEDKTSELTINNTPGDVGRLVTWLNEDNKLESILKYQYEDKFEKKEAKYQDIVSREEDAERGFLGKVINVTNPNYRNLFKAGKTQNTWANASTSEIFPGVGHTLFNGSGGGSGVLSGIKSGQNAYGSGNSDAIWTRYDQNRVYEPPATVRETYVYNGELSFTHEFTLVFDYELRAYENINPKTAFLDLLNNIQHVTYRKGKFWGGAPWFMGAPQNKKGWQTANALINKTFTGLENTFEALLSGNLNVGDLLGSLFNKVGNFLNSTMQKLSDPKQLLNNIYSTFKNNDGWGLLKGFVQNQLGRPALYAVNTILSGDPVGLWHVTIGNPRNPIVSMGNMIIQNAQIEHYGPLGLDDFPTGLKVSVTLHHGHPRDMLDIEKMYTQGMAGIGVPLSLNEYTDYISTSRYEAQKMATMWASTNTSSNVVDDINKKTKAQVPPTDQPEQDKKQQQKTTTK